jgi:hypothetical protein
MCITTENDATRDEKFEESNDRDRHQILKPNLLYIV